ncbi:MAG: hypothetical protein PHY14_04250 [Candidatus Gracilibacteria bacterium]|nr:hypothetical protein [Candidatus Gracilibacteria bacterium]
MVKIKDIRERLTKNPQEYLEIKLVIAKRTLAFFVLAYYMTLLFTIAGFSFSVFGFFVSLEFLSNVSFHLYSVLVIVVSWFMFSLIEYFQNIYFPTKSWIKLIGLIIALLFGIFGVVAHIGIHIL